MGYNEITDAMLDAWRGTNHPEDWYGDDDWEEEWDDEEGEEECPM